MIRAQPPVHSPIPFSALLAGAAALLGLARRARRGVETQLTHAFPGRRLVLTDSGTAALTLALRNACAGRPAAIPAYCCYDVATAVDGAGVDFFLYDLDPMTLGPDFGSLRRALDGGAGAVLAVHLYGLPVDWPRLEALAAEYGADVVEDAAQGAGGSIDGRPLGTLGPVGVLSFGRGKGMTGGGGGALALGAGLDHVGDDLPPGRASARSVAALAAQWLLARPAVYGIPSSIPWLGLGDTVYRPPSPPRRLSPVSRAVLSRTLPEAGAEAERRRRNAARLHALLAPTPLRPLRSGVGTPGYLRAPAMAPPSIRPLLRTRAARALGIMPGYPRSLADLEGFGARRRNPGEALAVSRDLAAGLVTFPTHGLLRERDWKRLAGWLAALPGE